MLFLVDTNDIFEKIDFTLATAKTHIRILQQVGNPTLLFPDKFNGDCFPIDQHATIV